MQTAARNFVEGSASIQASGFNEKFALHVGGEWCPDEVTEEMTRNAEAATEGG